MGERSCAFLHSLSLSRSALARPFRLPHHTLPVAQWNMTEDMQKSINVTEDWT